MAEGSGHNEMHYVKLWAWLLVMLVISIIGPEFGIKWVTLITAFGIAVVKAYLVAAKFMHLDVEKRFIHYMLYTMILFMALFYAGIAADIMNVHGQNWVNISAQENIQQFQHTLDELHKGSPH